MGHSFWIVNINIIKTVGYVITFFLFSPDCWAASITVRELAALNSPVTNNAVAKIQTPDGPVFFSFMGLEAGKTWRDTSSKAYALFPWESRWLPIASVPGKQGRLAGIAVGVNQSVYVIGGYTVDEDHSEKSVPTVHRYNTKSDTYTTMKPMPIPVDDTVALLYQDRFIYLVSGWHDSGNVNLVQVYDTESGLWFQATPFPGSPVFGHSGGIVKNKMVVCDGVKIAVAKKNPREFVPSNECYLGEIRTDDVTRIDWVQLPPHPGSSRYRMAATGSVEQLVVFAGGSTNPYNYDGVGYNGKPSRPSKTVFAFDIHKRRWLPLGDLDIASMDHRGLLESDKGFVIVGGMRGGQQVSAEVLEFSVERKALGSRP